MWPTLEDNLPNINIINNNKNRVISTTTSSSSSSSSPPSPTTTTTSLSRKTMDEVWKDINLSNLHDHHQQQPTMDFRLPTTLQDFLSRPFHTPSSAPPNMGPPPPQPPPPPPPHAMLSLKSNMNNFLYMDPLQTTNTGPSAAIANSDVSFEGGDVGSSGGLFSFYKRRLPEQDAISSDRRHKRMIKNRESAARSRSRKQAYAHELEIEVKKLTDLNARLRRQQEELRLIMAAQPPTTKKLQRTSTAPF
ncbi:Protein FD [Acorus gramineus]|uniref:Protein FD n=1 Tax=Acorus gramineus TaxID=55184 RepID=A0AAV9ABC9_ACOGR|nr:Protein FD [Acorus gramineus]